jgi:hypothetical protein
MSCAARAMSGCKGLARARIGYREPTPQWSICYKGNRAHLELLVVRIHEVLHPIRGEYVELHAA